MSNQWTKPFGRGRSPDFRSLGIGFGAWALCLVLGLIASASSATAAEIVEVRVGRHPTFTRVVFELDRAAGYRVERADPNAEGAELVVSFQATSDPVRIKAWKNLVRDVEVKSRGDRSIARIRLAKEGLRLKEMILASPPRIVLDVLSDQPAPAPIAKAKPKPKPKPKSRPTPTVVKTPPVREESSFEDVVAEIPVEPEVAKPTPAARPRPEPAPAPVVAEVAVIEEPVVAEPEPEIEPEIEVVVVDEPSTSIPVEEPEVAIEDDESEIEMAGMALDGSEMTESEADALVEARMAEAEADDGGSAGGQGVGETPPPAPPVERKPMMVAESADEGSGWMTWLLAGVAAVVLLVGGLIVVRGRRGGEEVDFGEDGAIDFGDGAEAGQAAQDDAPISASEDNPFAGLAGDGKQTTLGGPGDTTVSPMNQAGGTARTGLPLSADEEKESESVVFDDSEENVMDDMEVISREQVNESLGGAMPPAAGIPEEFQQMMREMSRRVEALESRCDELVDARDRLERQVAAQTEELRVQRAAIARTQRAVRNLARPEEAGEEEATEPALRDPNQPSSSE